MSKFVTLFIKQLKDQKKISMIKQQGQTHYQNKKETFKTQLCPNENTVTKYHVKKGQFVKGLKSSYTIYFKRVSDSGKLSENPWDQHRTTQQV